MNPTRNPTKSIVMGLSLVVVIDLAAKLAASVIAPESTSGLIIPMRNHEFSLGIAGGPPFTTIVIAAVGISLAAALVIPPARRGELRPWIPACLIGGALANLIDRVAFGSVHDFLATPWVVFNLADMAVVAGLTGLLTARLRPTAKHRFRSLANHDSIRTRC
ncbi:MAG: signal peptidase II [Acidimicrobiia bacterium]